MPREDTRQLRHVRPWPRRLSMSMNGPLATLVLLILALYLTIGPLTFIFGPDTSSIVSAVVALGEQLDEDAVSFQGVVLGVLAALFIGRVIAPVSDVRNQTAVEVGSAAAAHLLAAVVIATGVIVTVGVVGNSNRAGHAWFVIVLSVIAFGLAQAVEANVTFGLKRQRRRTRNDLINASWAVHRSAAALREAGRSRNGPRRRAAAILVGTAVLAAAVGFLIAAAAYGAAFSPYIIIGAGVALAIGVWSTLWAAFLAATVTASGASGPRRVVAWTMALLPSVVPAIGAVFAPTGAGAGALKAAIVITAAIPFVHAIDVAPTRVSLRTALTAVELRRHRQHRYVLLRDYYALHHRRRSSARNKDRRGWEQQMLAALQHGRIRQLAPLATPAALQRHRPTQGLGSNQWWESAGEPLMYLPAIRNH